MKLQPPKSTSVKLEAYTAPPLPENTGRKGFVTDQAEAFGMGDAAMSGCCRTNVCTSADDVGAECQLRQIRIPEAGGTDRAAALLRNVVAEGALLQAEICRLILHLTSSSMCSGLE